MSIHLVEVEEDNFAEELAARGPRTLANKWTYALAGLVLVIGGFIAGSLTQKSMGTSSSATTGTGAFPNFAAGNFAGRGQAGAGTGQAGGTGTGQNGANRAAAAASGTVKLVDGTTVYIETADGQVVTVKTSSTTAVQSAQTVKLSDLKAGAKVTVEGQAGTDGIVTATKVTATK